MTILIFHIIMQMKTQELKILTELLVVREHSRRYDLQNTVFAWLIIHVTSE